jgi:hypothetical protein
MEIANLVAVDSTKLAPLVPTAYSMIPAAALGIGRLDQGILLVNPYRGFDPTVDGALPSQPTEVAVDIGVLVAEPKAAIDTNVNIPGAYHFYTLAIYTDNASYAASLLDASFPVELVSGINYDRAIDEASGVGTLTVGIPVPASPLGIFDAAFGYAPAGALDAIFWHDSSLGAASLHFHDDPFRQGDAFGQIYTQPFSRWDDLLSGGGIGPCASDPITGFHCIAVPALNLLHDEGGVGQLVVVAPVPEPNTFILIALGLAAIIASGPRQWRVPGGR